MPVPSQFILEQTFEWTSLFTVGGIPTDADGAVAYSIYENGTDTAIATGTMVKLDDDNTTGLYRGSVSATADNGYERYKTYNVHITATVNSTAAATVGSSLCVGGSDTIQTTSGSLTTLSNFKEYAGITGTGDNTLISALINRSTSAIQKFTGRDLVETTYREIHDWDGSSDITSEQYPIILIDSLFTSRDTAFSVKYTGAGYTASASVSTTAVKLASVVGNTKSNTVLLYTANTTMAALITAINNLSGWEATPVNDDIGIIGSNFLLPISGLVAKNTFVGLEIPTDPGSGYVFDAESGIISLDSLFCQTWRSGRQNLILLYSAGFATTPADLEQICIDLTKVYYDSRQRDDGLKSEKIGDYSYTVGDVVAGKLPDSIKLRLSGYIRRVI